MAYAFLDVDRPVIAWLVYRGLMVSSSHAHPAAVSNWAMGLLRGSDNYEREAALESFRQTSMPDAISRWRCFYAFAEPGSARKAASSWGYHFREDRLAEISVTADSSVSRRDATWVTRHSGGPEVPWASSYFQGVPTDDPVWELNIAGRAWVLGTGLRQIAYETIRRKWPESLALLELSRVAAELGSDLGLITATVVDAPSHPRVVHVMSFADARDPAFLAQFAAYDGPKNTLDLKGSSDLIVPDLRDQAVCLVHQRCPELGVPAVPEL